ncbi:prenyltransferase [Nocardioidaceae bacterium]|nr:prenyltransferase [Nocardioidaceae bacterium]
MLLPTQPSVPHLPGVLTKHDVRATGASIVAVQEADGAIPWSRADRTDVWNHVEAAMALVVTGHLTAAHQAYEWCAATQREDGSWPMRTTMGEVDDTSGETNMSAYLAVGVWHHWLVRRDRRFVDRMWPHVRAGLDFVVALQQPVGGIAWSVDPQGRTNREMLLTASSSIHQSLGAGLALAGLVDDPQPHWELALGRLGHALREHRDAFEDLSHFAMDWYYPVLGGAVRGEPARELLRGALWDRFVTPGVGIRCVVPNEWWTGAETCELVMALHAVGEESAARALFADMQHLRHRAGGYWTGFVEPDRVNWPRQQTTFTAAAVVLAADQLSGTTPGADIMVGRTLVTAAPEIGLGCGCPDDPEVRDRTAEPSRRHAPAR